MKPVSEVADLAAFSHKYSIHMSFLHDKMPSASPPELQLHSQIEQPKNCRSESGKDLPTPKP